MKFGHGDVLDVHHVPVLTFRNFGDDDDDGDDVFVHETARRTGALRYHPMSNS